MTREPAATTFCGVSLQWTYDPMATESGTGHWLGRLYEQPVLGIMNMNRPDFGHLPADWFSYLKVDEVDGRVGKAEKAGAEIPKPPSDAPDIGHIAILQDATGAGIRWMTSAPQN